jgi:hypothetical protein
MTYMADLVTYMRALSLFDEVLETAHSSILEDLIEGDGKLLRQFKLVVDDQRGDDDKQKVVDVADRLIEEAHSFMMVVSAAFAGPLDELRLERSVTYRTRQDLPINPQEMYDLFEPLP